MVMLMITIIIIIIIIIITITTIIIILILLIIFIISPYKTIKLLTNTNGSKNICNGNCTVRRIPTVATQRSEYRTDTEAAADKPRRAPGGAIFFRYTKRLTGTHETL